MPRDRYRLTIVVGGIVDWYEVLPDVSPAPIPLFKAADTYYVVRPTYVLV